MSVGASSARARTSNAVGRFGPLSLSRPIDS